MRTKITVINSISTMVFQILIMIIGFIVPRWIIVVYGSEVNGLTSNINQVLNMINLLQAGLVGASIFELYKPISEDNAEVIGAVFYSTKKYFEKMSYVFWGLTLLMIPLMLLNKDVALKPIDIVFSVLILGFNATIVFRYYCKYDVIFSAYQKKYILVVSSVIEKLVYYGILFLILVNKWNFILMYVSVLIGSEIKILFLRCYFDKQYKTNIGKYKGNTGYKVKNQYHLFGNQIIQNIIESLPTVVVTFFWGMKYASVLSIYLLITNFIKMVFYTLQNAVAASFGDYIASESKEKVIDMFELIQTIFCLLLIPVMGCLGRLYLPFISLYSNNTDSFSYVYFNLGIVMSIYIMMMTSFFCFNLMINSIGYYGKVLKANIIIGIVAIAIMIGMTKVEFQLAYLGTAFFYFASILHRFYILRKNEIKIGGCCLVNAFIPCVALVVGFLIAQIYDTIDSSLVWGGHAIINFVFWCFISYLYLFIFRKNQKEQIKIYLKRIVRRK